MPSNLTLSLGGEAGRLEALLQLPDGPPLGAGLVCHAHPLQGGMMHFKVVFRAAKALQEAGYACLRFNFRGVGASQGVHDEGRGEQDDVRTALDELRRRFPGLPLILGGFSFGAAMAYRVGVREKDLKALFVMGLPVSSIERAHRPEGLPLLIVQGEQDRFGSGAEVQAFVETLAPPVTVKIVLGSDHFFSGQEMALQGILADWFRSLP